MHGIDESRDMVGVHMLVDAVAEVEDMAIAVAELLQDQSDFLAYGVRFSVKDGRIHVALQ